MVSARVVIALLCVPACAAHGVEPAPSEPAASEPAASEPAPVEPAEPTLADALLGFRHRGEPIHPLALAAMYSTWTAATSVVDLDAQGWPAEGLTVDGNVVEFEHADGPGWDVYEVHARVGSRFLVSANHNGGGTGRFTPVHLVELQGSRLVPVTTATGGDRCNGGLAEGPDLAGDAIVIGRYLTPWDLVDPFSSRDSSGLAAYEDLEASATSCIGYVTVRVDPSGDETVLGVTFSPDSTGQWHGDTPGWTERYRLQPCFNRIYARWVAAGRTELDAAAVDEFVDELFAECEG
jgi:hypothetical protein